MTSRPLITVVVPAYNAAATIDETLRSVRSQTCRALEILVVDDGSTDATADIVLTHARSDSRIRLVRQANGGVASARNRGIKEATADLVAFVDADDLWAPHKLEKQIAALRNDGPSVALVYTWYAQIDEASRITDITHRPLEAGDVLERMCLGNLVGNGSSILARKAALEEVGGFDTKLRARRAQGCEDLLLYFRLAERHHFALVQEWLTGYRQTSANMSSDLAQMRRSWLLVADEMRCKHPKYKRAVAKGTVYFTAWLLGRAIEMRRARQVLRFGALLLAIDPLLAGRTLVINPLGGLARRLRRACRRRGHSATAYDDILPRFVIGDPDRAA